MKAILIRKAEGWYNLYQDKIGIGSTHEELQGYKLSKQNCDEIFGVVDVEKLFNEVDETIDFHEFCFSSFKLGFNKAMELNKDNQFTSRNMLRAYIEGTNDGAEFESMMDYDSEDNAEAYEFAKEAEKEFIKSLQQPTEIEVEIEMEVADLAFYENGERHPIEANLPERFKYKPKLNSDGCLILKKINQL